MNENTLAELGVQWLREADELYRSPHCEKGDLDKLWAKFESLHNALLDISTQHRASTWICVVEWYSQFSHNHLRDQNELGETIKRAWVRRCLLFH